jgi:hypothetical protein
MPSASAFSDVPVAGRQAPLRLAAKLRELGDFDTAEMIEAAERRATDPSLSFGVLEGLFKPRPTGGPASGMRQTGPRNDGAQRSNL